METIKNSSQIAMLVITFVGFIKPFIPAKHKDLIPLIAIIIGVIIAIALKQDAMAVVDGIMGSVMGVMAYKVGSTKTRKVSTNENDSEVENIIQTLNKLKK